MKKSILAVTLLTFALSAMATNGHHETPPPVTSNHGGTGIGVGVGVSMSGSLSNSNSSVKSSVSNTNRVHSTNRQRQHQNQHQTQSSNSVSNTGPSTSNVSDANNAAQTVHIDSAKIPVSTAYAATIAPTAVCMGTSSGGAQGPGLGLSFGTSWTDENCMLLEQVRTVAVILQDGNTAEEMMCGLDSYREARARLHKPCKSAKKVASVEPKPEYTDPIVRSRLGLPPLKD